MKTFTFFGGAQNGNDPSYMAQAEKLGYWLGKKPCIIKYGGSAMGLMGAFCRGVLKGEKEKGLKTRIIGVLPEKYFRVNRPETLPIEFKVTEDLTERKELLLEGTDAFLVLPGGTGTLDEIFEAIEQDYLPADRDPSFQDYCIRPIFVLNYKDYYKGTIEQLEEIKRRGFISKQKLASLHFYDTLDDMIGALERFYNGVDTGK